MIMFNKEQNEILARLTNEEKISQRVKSIMCMVDFSKDVIEQEIVGWFLEELTNFLYDGETVLFFNPSSYMMQCTALMLGPSGKQVVVFTNQTQRKNTLAEILTSAPEILNENRVVIFDVKEDFLQTGPYNVILFYYSKINSVPEMLLSHLKPLGRLIIWTDARSGVCFERIDKLENNKSIRNIRRVNTTYPLTSVDVELKKLQSKLVANSRDSTELIQIKDTLTCPVCLDQPTPPTALCQQGHVICNACKSKLPRPECPLCRGNYVPDFKNTSMDQILEQMKTQCRGQQLGCKASFKLDDLNVHEKYCEYLRKLQCPLEDCESDVRVISYCNHIRIRHEREIKYIQGFPLEFTHYFNQISENVHKTVLLEEEILSQTFECQYRVDNGYLLAVVKYIGSETSRHNYRVQIRFEYGEYHVLTMSIPLSFDAGEDEMWSMPNLFVKREELKQSVDLEKISITFYISCLA